MRFDVLTLFPDSMDRLLGESIIGRAREAGHVTINTVNIRDYSANKHRKVDDAAYGGGTGLVMTPQPIYDAWKAILASRGLRPEERGSNGFPRTVYMSPQGRVLSQQIAHELKDCGHLIVLCGHYEGVDERLLEEIVDEEISIGDYVLTGGELPAMVLIDCISRMVEGVLPSSEAYTDESHYNGLLEYPQYTRPPVFMDRPVPDILLSGHHANVKKWHYVQMLERTRAKRPDMYAAYEVEHRDQIDEALGLKVKKKRTRGSGKKKKTEVAHE